MKKFLSFVTLSVALSFLIGCGSDSSSPSADSSVSESSDVSVEEPAPAPDLTGHWQQTNSQSEDSFQSAVISEDEIEIFWDSTDLSALYWAGTFSAPSSADEPYVWESVNDTSKTDSAMLASGADTKAFTFENDSISYDVTMQGVTATVHLEKISELSEESSSDSSATSSSEFFENNVFQTADFKIEITDYKVLAVGDVGNEYGDFPVIAFWYDITNLSDDMITPSEFLFSMTAIQDNDPNFVNELEVSSHPDDAYVDTQMADIKPGGTLTNATAYELDDLTTPVTLVASPSLFDDPIGEQVFEIQ